MPKFKKKPGGSFFGNLIRTAANKFSGGVLGNGDHRLPVEGAPPMKSNFEAQQDTFANISNMVKDSFAAQPAVKKAIAQGIWEKYKFYFIGGAVSLVSLISYLSFRKPKFKRKY